MFAKRCFCIRPLLPLEDTAHSRTGRCLPAPGSLGRMGVAADLGQRGRFHRQRAGPGERPNPDAGRAADRGEGSNEPSQHPTSRGTR
ncbi:hypothetical protein FKM82_024247 [Ascaphus truei]